MLTKVRPFLITLNPVMGFVAVFKVNSSGEITYTVALLAIASIIACGASLSSTTLLDLNCVRPASATACGPTRVNPVPFHAYNCLVPELNQKSPTESPVGSVVPTSAPPVVLNLVPS